MSSAEFGGMLFFTLAGALLVWGATALHRVLGLIVLVPACGIVLLLAVNPEVHLVTSLVSCLLLYGAHGAVVQAARERAAAAAPPPQPVLTHNPVPKPPLAPAAPREEPRPARVCAGCGATARQGSDCAYCGRHI